MEGEEEEGRARSSLSLALFGGRPVDGGTSLDGLKKINKKMQERANSLPFPSSTSEVYRFKGSSPRSSPRSFS